MMSRGLCSPCQRLDLVEVDAAVLAPHPVLRRVEPLAGEVRGRAMGQVSAGRQRHAKDGVTRLQQCEHDALVGLGPGMRLNVGERAVEELAGAGDGKALGDVDEFAPAVVPPRRIALRVLVGENRPLGLQHRAGDDVLRCDQLDAILLAMQLVLDALREHVIGLREGGAEECPGNSRIVKVH